MPVWIRIMDLPLERFTEESALALGGALGEVVDTDVGEDSRGWGEFLRVRVAIDVNQPLRRVIRVACKKDGRLKEGMHALKYERLPFFCHRCGRLDHIERDCDQPKRRGAMQEYGPNIRASPVRKFFGESFTRQRQAERGSPSPRGAARWAGGASRGRGRRRGPDELFGREEVQTEVAGDAEEPEQHSTHGRHGGGSPHGKTEQTPDGGVAERDGLKQQVQSKGKVGNRVVYVVEHPNEEDGMEISLASEPGSAPALGTAVGGAMETGAVQEPCLQICFHS